MTQIIKPNIDGVKVVPLKQFLDERGKIMQMLKSTDEHFNNFAEIHFSFAYPGVVKGWHVRPSTTSSVAVIYGKVKWVLFDDREVTNNQFQEVIISKDNYCRLTVPPMVWVGFKGLSETGSMLLNIANIGHDPLEVDRKNIKEIEFNWNS